jgi:putative hemolysin
MTKNKLDIKSMLPKKISWLAPILYKITGISAFHALFNSVPSHLNPFDAIKYLIKASDTTLVCSNEEQSFIPKTGPIIVVANHPHGFLDGLGLSYLMLSVRDDVKFFANSIFSLIAPPSIKSLYLDVDVFSDNSPEKVLLLHKAEQFLATHGALCIFPSGVVSHWHWKEWGVTDSTWSNSAAWLAKKTNATIIPVYIEGTNSWYFQVAGIISKHLRTLLLGQQYVAQKKRPLKIRIGRAISYPELTQQGSLTEQTHYIRNKTYFLRCKDNG